MRKGSTVEVSVTYPHNHVLRGVVTELERDGFEVRTDQNAWEWVSWPDVRKLKVTAVDAK